MESLVLQLLLLLAAQLGRDGNDPDLLLKIKEGDHEAFKSFFDQYHNFLLNYLLKQGASEETAKDLVQQAFLIIWEKRSSIDPEKSLRSYLFRIAYTRLLNSFRDNAKFDGNAQTDQLVTEEEQAEEDHSHDGLNKDIETAIGQMPEKRQAVFRLCFIQEFSYREVADILNISIKTVENHMGLALKDLRKALHKYQ